MTLMVSEPSSEPMSVTGDLLHYPLLSRLPPLVFIVLRAANPSTFDSAEDIGKTFVALGDLAIPSGVPAFAKDAVATSSILILLLKTMLDAQFLLSSPVSGE